MDSMDELSNEHTYDLIRYPSNITSRGSGRDMAKASSYDLHLVVVYDKSMVDAFGSSAKTR